MAGTIEFELGEKSLAAIRSLTEALSRLQGPATPTDGGKELLSRKEAAKFLGISPSTLSEWVRNGYIPKGFEMSERNLRWKKSDLLAFAGKKRRAA